MASYLDAFSIRVRKKRAARANRIGDFDDSGSDMFVFFDRFLSNLAVATSHDQSFAGLIRVEGRTTDPNRRTVTATLLAGHYGKVSQFFDIYTSEMVFPRKRRHAEALSFYIKAFFPRDQDEGIILVQRIGGSSPSRALRYFLTNLFRENHRGLVLELNSLVNREQLDEILNRGITEKIRISDFHLHRRVEEVQDRGFHEEVSASLVIRQRADEQRNMLRDIVRSLAETRRTGIAELDEHIDENSKIKISIEEDGRTHLIDLSSPKVRLSREVNEFPETDIESYRDYLEREANEFIGIVATKIWGEQSNVWQH